MNLLIHKYSQSFFKVFLVVYAGSLLIQAKSLSWDSPLATLVSLGAGFALVLFAHSRTGYITIALLTLHISLEWYEHARHMWHYSLSQTVVHAIHTLLDITFVLREIRLHAKKHFKLVVGILTSGITTLFFAAYVPTPKNPYLVSAMKNSHSSHSHNHGPMGPFLIGGVLGCVLYHTSRIKKDPA